MFYVFKVVFHMNIDRRTARSKMNLDLRRFLRTCIYQELKWKSKKSMND